MWILYIFFLNFTAVWQGFSFAREVVATARMYVIARTK